jgi:hypothetical protein
VLARRDLRDPVTHEIDSAASHVRQMQHHLFLVDTAERSDAVAHLLGGRGRSLAFARVSQDAASPPARPAAPQASRPASTKPRTPRRAGRPAGSPHRSG